MTMQYFMYRLSQTVRITSVLVSGITRSDPDLNAFSEKFKVSIVWGDRRRKSPTHAGEGPL